MKVCVVGGCGRLGLPIAARAAHCGHEVVCADVNETEVARINMGVVDRMEPGVSQLVLEGHRNGRLSATTNTRDAARDAELIIIIVPTPSKHDGSFSAHFVKQACAQIGEGIRESTIPYQVVSLSSTVMPGDTEGKALPALQGDLFEPVDMGLVYAPEFVRQGSIIHDFSNPDFLLIGESEPRAGEVIERFYEPILMNVPYISHMSIVEAEITKIGLNATVVSKIAVASQLAMLCHDTRGARASLVLKTIGTDRRIGREFFGAGTWPGGPCFPRDCYALARALYRGDTPSMIADAVRDFNVTMAQWLAQQIEDLAAGRHARVVGILGLAYKPGVDLIEESQGLRLANLFHDWLSCRTYDPAIQDPNESRRCGSVAELADASDVIVLMTKWPEFTVLSELDLEGKIIFDMWGWIDSMQVNCDVIVFGEGE